MISIILLVFAFVIFAVDAFNWVSSKSVELLPLGLGFWVLAVILSGVGPGPTWRRAE